MRASGQEESGTRRKQKTKNTWEAAQRDRCKTEKCRSATSHPVSLLWSHHLFSSLLFFRRTEDVRVKRQADPISRALIHTDNSPPPVTWSLISLGDGDISPAAPGIMAAPVLPCHLCLLIVSLSYIGEVNMSPASDRRAFIWKISLLPTWLFFLLLFFFSFLSLYAFLSLSFCVYCLLSSRRGEEVVKVKWLCLDTDFTSWLGEVTACGWKVHIHLLRWGGERDRHL